MGWLMGKGHRVVINHDVTHRFVFGTGEWRTNTHPKQTI